MKRLPFAKHLPMPVVLALMLLSTDWAQGQSRTPDCYVISAGIDSYQQVNDLKGCVADARNTVAAFQAQRGKLFGTVYAQTLVDGQATHAHMLRQMYDLSRVGTSGDFVVIFLSGHGGRTNNNQSWYFLPQDYNAQNHAGTALTDRQILDAADALVMQGKKVFVIVDACYAGQLNVTARSYFPKYRNPQAGGLVLMLSSSANQTSSALGQYSAFAKAFADAMIAGDLNRDSRITIGEIRRYSYERTHSLIKQHGLQGQQDSEVSWSPSISEQTPLALTQRIASNGTTTIQPNPQPPVAEAARVWVGNESLAGFGRLAFHFYQGGRAVMHDAAGASEGTWRQNGSIVTLHFANGRVVYTGTLRGPTLSGQASNNRTNWTFSVTDSLASR